MTKSDTAGDPLAEDTAAYMRALGKRLRLLRLAQELTQDQVALATGISRSFVSLLEHGARGVDIVRLVRLARLFGIPIHELVDVGDAGPRGARACT
jgi:transcriptional regulator with XRE-family HTH domain